MSIGAVPESSSHGTIKPSHSDDGKLSLDTKASRTPETSGTGRVDGYFKVIESLNCTTPEKQMNGNAEKPLDARRPLGVKEVKELPKQRHTLAVPPVQSSGHRARSSTASTASPINAPEEFAKPAAPAAAVPPSPILRRSASLTLMRHASRSVTSDLHISADDNVSPTDGPARWAEAIRAKRASKRRRLEEEEDERVLVGTKVGPGHSNFSTMYNMLTGIRVGVSRCNAKVDRELTPADFEAKHKFSFDIIGSELTPSAKYDFKFKDYAPWVFRHLRQLFHLDPADYLISLTSKYILSELNSPGKSGSFFYFSRDYRFIIKTISQREHKFLRKILKDYYKHVENNPNTLISQFYGLHRVKEPYGKKLHFVVMNNLFPPHRDIHQTYDLKGSTQGRDFQEENLKDNPRATVKDLNWLRREMVINLGPKKAQAFIAQLEKDVNMLRRLNIMDYSLLLGIHDLLRGNKEGIRDSTLSMFQPEPEISPLTRTPSKLEQARKARELRRKITSVGPTALDQSTLPREHIERRNFTFYGDDGGFRATDDNDQPGDVIYYLGVIDCLTSYGPKKYLETFFKTMKHSRALISAIPPDEYGERFLKFITAQVKTRRQQALEKERQQAEKTGSLNRQKSAERDKHRYVEKAEKKARESEKHSREENVPERRLTTERSQDTPAAILLSVRESNVDSDSGRGIGAEDEGISPVSADGGSSPLTSEREGHGHLQRKVSKIEEEDTDADGFDVK